MKYIKLLLLFVFLQTQAQQGGMWIPSLLKGMNESEMKNLGMKISAEDIYSVNKSSLKDAVPHFDGGCTAEMISDKGLLLTNHHCGFDNIQSHSTVEKDYLTDGFWAYKMDEELPNKDLYVTFIIKIEDVTTKVLEGTETMTSEGEKQKKIQANISSLTKNSPKESWQENSIKTFYDGNQYLLFVTEKYTDVRLVGAPPSSIGKFGSDTDNWVGQDILEIFRYLEFMRTKIIVQRNIQKTTFLINQNTSSLFLPKEFRKMISRWLWVILEELRNICLLLL